MSDGYFAWLTSRISPYATGYILLANVLHHIEYYSLMMLDENRAKDAIRMREEYISEFGGSADDSPPSVLEVMVAMAIRINDEIMYDNREPNRTGVWFKDMLDNLGLSAFDDISWTIDSDNYARAIVTRWLDRRYARNGRGSPWPLRRTVENLKNVQFWDMVQWYWAENYDRF